MYVEVSRAAPDPEKSSMHWPLAVLPITEHTSLIRKATFVSLFPSQPGLHFQIPFVSLSLTGRDRRAALKRSLQNWCPAAYCTFTAFIFGGMALSGSTGDRVDFRCQFSWAWESWRLWARHKEPRLVCLCCVPGLSLFFPISASQWGIHALGHRDSLLPNSHNRSEPIPPQGYK